MWNFDHLEQLSAVREDWLHNLVYSQWRKTDPAIIDLLEKWGWIKKDDNGTFFVTNVHFEIRDFIENLQRYI